MEEFMSQQAFTTFVIVKVIVACIIAFCFYKFARRDATAFDTIYRKRFRYAIVVFFGFCAVLSLCHVIFGVADFELPFYYRSLYGTSHPDTVTLETGLGEYTVLHGPSEICYWGRLTFEQWSLSTWIAHFILCIGLLLYFIRFQRSSIKWHAKLRKFIGYVILYAFPSLINSFHYFDFGELFRFAIFVIIAYFLVRSYKRDAKPAELPKESISHPNIPEFEAISPMETSQVSDEDIPSSNSRQVEDSAPQKPEDITSNHKNFSINSALKWCGGVIVLFLIGLISMSIIRDEIIPSNLIQSSYHYEALPNVWITMEDDYLSFYHTYYRDNFHNKVGLIGNTEPIYALGEPNPKAFYALFCMRPKGRWDYVAYDSFHACRIAIYDISELYGDCDDAQYLQKIAARFRNKKAIITENVPYEIFDYSPAVYFQEQAQANDIPHDVLILDEETKEFVKYSNFTLHNYILCKNGIAYHLKYYYLPNVGDLNLIDKIYIGYPAKIWNIFIIICTTLFIGLCILFVVLWSLKNKKRTIVNKHANRLQWYIISNIVLQTLIITGLAIVECIPDAESFWDGWYINIIVVGLGLVLINLPLLIYVSRKIEIDYSEDYLMPEWYKEKFVNVCKNKSVCTKLSLAFIFYPIFYVAVLPFGICILTYLLPIAIVCALVYFFRWVFDSKQQEKPVQKKKNKQYELAGNTLKEKLQLLKSMLDEGLITQEDYDRKKEDILRNM